LVVITNPAPADCKTTETVNLHVEPPPTVSAVVPGTVCTGGKTIAIDGTGFIANPAVSLEATGQASVPAGTVTTNTTGTQLTASIGAGAQLGVTYDVVVTNPD